MKYRSGIRVLLAQLLNEWRPVKVASFMPGITPKRCFWTNMITLLYWFATWMSAQAVEYSPIGRKTVTKEKAKNPELNKICKKNDKKMLKKIGEKMIE